MNQYTDYGNIVSYSTRNALTFTVCFIFAESVSAHWVVPGGQGYVGNDPSNEGFCLEDTLNEGPIEAHFGKSIVVSCCLLDGSDGVRPDCSAYPRTYDEAVQVCESHGYRLCTKEEMIYGCGSYDNTCRGLTHGKGCSFNYALNWVSDSCGSSNPAPTGTWYSSPLFRTIDFVP